MSFPRCAFQKRTKPKPPHETKLAPAELLFVLDVMRLSRKDSVVRAKSAELSCNWWTREKKQQAVKAEQMNLFVLLERGDNSLDVFVDRGDERKVQMKYSKCKCRHQYFLWRVTVVQMLLQSYKQYLRHVPRRAESMKREVLVKNDLLLLYLLRLYLLSIRWEKPVYLRTLVDHEK